MALDSNTFFEVIQKHGLVSEKKLSALKNAITKDALSQADLESLVSKKYLTKWQANRLINGKHNFSVGDYRLVDYLGKDEFGEVYLVCPKGTKDVKRLRLLAKEISQDQTRLESYLQRVKSLQAIQHSRLTRVEQLTEVGGRHVVVTGRPSGKSIGKGGVATPTSPEVVQQMIVGVSEVLQVLAGANLHHGTINENTICLLEEDQWQVDLPSDIAFSAASKGNCQELPSDVGALGLVAAGLVTGNLRVSSPSGDQTADKLIAIAVQPNATLDELQSALGGPAVPAIPELAPSVESVGSDVTADALESIDKQDDMFGNFDQVEVVSEIQATQPVTPSMPVIVDNPTPGGQTAKANGTKAKDGNDPNAANQVGAEKQSSNVALFAAIGGGVGVVVLGLIIFFLLRGNNNEADKVAVNSQNTSANDEDGEAAKKGDDTTSQKDNENPEPGTLKKKELKSSGLFKGVGAINQNDGKQSNGKGQLAGNPGETTTGNEASKSPVPNVNPTPDKSDQNAKDETPKKIGGLGQNSGIAKGGSAPGVNPVPTPDKGGSTQPPLVIPNETKGDESTGDQVAKLPGGTAGAGQNDPDKAKNAKSDEVLDDEVLLIGRPKKDKDKNESAAGPAKLANPFAKAPNFVSLQLPKKGSDNSAFQKLIQLAIPPSLPLNVTLHGGDNASKSKIKFELKASTSQNATWVVSAGNNASLKPIAKFHFDGNHFGFSWEPEASGFSNSVYLINCALRIQASEYKHEVALRTPSVAKQLDLTESFSAKGDAALSNLPNMENVKVVLVNVPAKFPKFEYPKNKAFLANRVDSVKLAFKKDNIDVIQGILSSRLRGSKMTLALELNYVTPDKKLQKLASKEKFEKAAKQLIDEANLLDAELKRLNTEYNKLQTKEQKAEFTRLTGRNKLQQQVTVSNRYKTHMQNTLEILNGIAASKLSFRVFYQAGEIEVDLATPNGKKYKPARPKPAQPAGKKAKNKKSP